MVYHYDLNTKKHNPRSYRRDDSYHNSVGAVSGFFAGLLGVTLALGGTGCFLFGGLVVASQLSMDTSHCTSNSRSWGCGENDKQTGIIQGLVLITIGTMAVTGSGAIMKNYNS